MIGLNFSFMMSEIIGENGVSERKLESLRKKAREGLNEIKQKKWKELGFIDLPDQNTSAVKKEAERLRSISEYFLLLGIGGSSLGPKCILESLSPFHNQVLSSNPKLGGRSPKVYIYENVDPSTLNSILKITDLKRTSVNVITKSGSTAETAAGFLILYDEMRKVHGDNANERFVITTDPEKGEMRKLVNEKGFPSLSIPPGVGGRYSVLSPVGLLLAEIIGIDSNELLRGAKDIQDRCMKEELWENPALIFASLCYLMDKEEGRKITVLIPYADRMRAFSEWFCQLWAESLGKLGMGLSPYPSVGTTDQHSQLQLWMEGPQDKVVVFMKFEDYGADYKIPEVFPNYGNMNYLGGHNLSELIKAEEEASELALMKAGRPNMTISVPRIDAYYLGQLFYFFEIVTPLVGFYYGVNPFNQPSVEEGKLLTFGMMGKPGFEKKKDEILEARKKKTIFRL